MKEMLGWLQELGLEQYATVLATNDVDYDLLCELSENDLEKLGFSLGHRRKLLKALASRASASAAEKADTSPAEAERRQVTVLFADLVGSTALANEIDPEEMSALIKRYQEICAGAIARFDGFIAKFMGDGVLAYFGYPQAQENAAERSVYAALAIIESLAGLKNPNGEAARSRIGIATGLVVIGDIIGSGVAREHSIVGETPNLAARLQSVAEPNWIVISQSTHRLLGRQFDYESLGKHNLKGFVEPVKAWRVTREAVVASRFAAGRAAEITPFVGRTQEIALLLDRWELAKQGEGQAVVLAGEAGMGKSRMAEVLRGRIGDDAYYYVICQCSNYYTNSPLHPVIRQLERALRFSREDSASAKLDKLTEFLRATDNLNDSTLDLFAELLSIPLDNREAPPSSSSVQRKVAIIAAVVQQLLHLAEQKPVLFVLEDAHWIDPTTLELITRLIDSISGTRLFAIITARLEFSSPWTDRNHVTALALNRLSKAQCTELIASVAVAALQSSMISEIVGKTDGVPLFAEELTKSIIEATDSADRAAIPATLRDSLMARLDRTGPAKEIALTAAVIGQQFSLGLLEKVAAVSSSELDGGLDRLVHAGLIIVQTRSIDPSYSFKHALIRDTAYNNLLKTRRQSIHERVARSLEEQFPAVVESEPELVAQHFSRAGLAEPAASYYQRAGERAAARSNFAEAVANFEFALRETANLSDEQKRMHRELALLLKLGPALTVMLGPQSPKVEETYQQCRDSAKSLGDEAATFKATWGLWYSANIGRKLKEARDCAEELMALGERSSDPDLFLEALHCSWSTAFFRGDVAMTLRDGREGVNRYDPAKHSWMAAVFGGHDPGVCAQGVYGSAVGQTGLIQEAHKAIGNALSLAEQLNQPNSIAHALLNATVVCLVARDYHALSRHAQHMLELADQYNFPPNRAHARIMSGLCRALGEGDAEGLATIEAEFPRASAIGPMFRIYGAVLAEARLRFEKISEALEVLDWALGTVTEPGVGLYVPELHRLKGVCLLRLDSSAPEKAIHSLQMAFHIAQQQGATLFQLRAAMDLAEASRGTEAEERFLQSLADFCGNLPPEFDATARAAATRLLAR